MALCFESAAHTLWRCAREALWSDTPISTVPATEKPEKKRRRRRHLPEGAGKRFRDCRDLDSDHDDDVLLDDCHNDRPSRPGTHPAPPYQHHSNRIHSLTLNPSNTISMPIATELTKALNLRVPLVQGGMQWVGRASLASAVSNAGALGILTALTQPSPQALKDEIKRANLMLETAVRDRCPRFGAIGVNITLLPSINPPDYAGYARAALEEGVRIFETAGSSPGPIIKLLKDSGAYVIHKCTSIRHALSSQKLGVDCLSIDGFECAGHPGEQDIGGLVLIARAREELKVPFIASGGIANGDGLAAALALGAAGANMGTRFMCTAESVSDVRIVLLCCLPPGTPNSPSLFTVKSIKK